MSLLTFLEKQEELDKKYENLNRSVKFEDIYNERINNFAQKPVVQLDDSEKDLF